MQLADRSKRLHPCDGQGITAEEFEVQRLRSGAPGQLVEDDLSYGRGATCLEFLRVPGERTIEMIHRDLPFAALEHEDESAGIRTAGRDSIPDQRVHARAVVDRFTVPHRQG